MVADILVVDDSRSMRNLIEGILKASGHAVVTAEDGTQAMDLARNHEVDLVLTDQNMPGMSGTSLVHKLRRLDHYKDIPIIMVTTERGDFTKEKAKNLGASGWLQKPFDPERLMKAVDAMLARFN